MAFALPQGYTYAYDENGNIVLVPIGSQNALQIASPIDMTGENPNLQQKTNPFLAKPMKPHLMDTKPIDMEGTNKQLEKVVPFRPVPLKPHLMDTKPIDMTGQNPNLQQKTKVFDMTQPIPLPPSFVAPPALPGPRIENQLQAPVQNDYPDAPTVPTAVPNDYPDATNPPRTNVPLVPSSLGYIAGQGLIGAAQGGQNVNDANQAELYSMGFPVEPPGSQPAPTPQEYNQQVFGSPDVTAPNPIAKYVGAGVNSLASNPLALAGGGLSAGARPIIGGINAAIGAGMGSQAGADLAPNSPWASIVGGLFGGLTGGLSAAARMPRLGNVVSQGVRAAEDDIAPATTNITDRLRGRQVDGTAAPPVYAENTVQPEIPKTPFADLPLEVQDQIVKARWFKDPMSYANSPAANKHLPVNVFDPPSVQNLANAESDRLFQQWKDWRAAGYLEPDGGSVGASRTPADLLNGHGDNAGLPDSRYSFQYTPESAAYNFDYLTGPHRLVQTHGAAAEALNEALRPSASDLPRLQNENLTDYVNRIGQWGGERGQQYLRRIQQNLKDIKPVLDDANSAKTLRNYADEHDIDLTDSKNMTRENISDFLEQLRHDRNVEARTGEPFQASDENHPDIPLIKVNDIHDNDMKALKDIRDGLPPSNTPPNSISNEPLPPDEAGGSVGAARTPPHMLADLPPGLTRTLGDGSTHYYYHDDPLAHVNFHYDKRTGLLTINQFNKGDFPSHSMPRMIADALASQNLTGASRPDSFLLKNIINKPTLEQLDAYIDPGKTLLGNTMHNAADLMGGVTSNVKTFEDGIDQTHMIGNFDWNPYTTPNKSAPVQQTPAASIINNLTDRQNDVAQLLAQGLSEKEIARRLNVSPNTAGVHTQAIMRQLGVDNRRDAQLALMKAYPGTSSAPIPNFSEIEQPVLDLVLKGMAVPDIATELGKSVGAIKSNVKSIGAKLKLSPGEGRAGIIREMNARKK